MTAADLRRWREKVGMTQREAGEWYGCPPKSAERTWRRWERGERRVPPSLIRMVQTRLVRRARKG